MSGQAQHKTVKYHSAFRWQASPVVIVAAVILLVCWSAALFVILVDPLDLYPWGVTVKLKEVDYNSKAGMPYVLKAAIKNGENDAFLIGGSTSLGFTQKLLNTNLRGIHHAFNLSYSGPRPFDRRLVENMLIDQIEKHHARPKMVLLAVDWFYQARRSQFDQSELQPLLPTYLYDDSLANDVRMINAQTLRLSWNALRSQRLWLPQWNIAIDEASNARLYRKFQSANSMAAIGRLIEDHRSDVDTSSSANCDDYFLIRDELVPFARRLSGDGVPVNLFFPPLSLAIYYVWPNDGKHTLVMGKTMLEDQLRFRRCLVRALTGIPGVRIFNFDDNWRIVGDLGNYREAAHVQNERVYGDILQRIAQSKDLLLPSNVDAENARLRDWVKNYQLYDSANGIGHAPRS